MVSFILGLALGALGKWVYDWMQEEPQVLTNSLGGQSRLTSVLEDIRDVLRDMRDQFQPGAAAGSEAAAGEPPAAPRRSRRPAGTPAADS